MRAGVALALVLVAATPLARADDPPPPPSDPASAEAALRAEELIRIGVELRRAGRESEALDRFREANALHSSPRALGQMGLAAKSLRLYVEAERCLEGALAATADPWVQQNREALELARDVVANQLASLMVTSNVEGAELLVNGLPVATLPLARPVRVDAGTVSIEVRAPRHKAAQSAEMLPAGQTMEVRIDLTAAPAPPFVAATTRADRPPEERRSMLPWILAAGGVGVAGVAVGSVFGLRALSLKDERDLVCPGDGSTPCPDGKGVALDDEARRSALVSTVGFAVGGVALGAAAVLLVIELGSRSAPATPRVTGGPTARGGFVGAHWAF